MKVRKVFAFRPYILIAALFLVLGNMSYGQRKDSFFHKIKKEGSNLVFSTSREANTSSCCAIRYVDGLIVDTIRQIEVDTNNRKELNWRISLVDGEYKLRIKLNDIEGHCHETVEEICYRKFCYWILSIGTGDNQKRKGIFDLKDLQCSAGDAELFVSLVENVIGCEPVMKICLNDSSATKKRIVEKAKIIANDIENYKEVSENCAVFVYLSGHGVFNDNKFGFQVKDLDGYDDDTLSNKTIIDLLSSYFEKNDKTDVWLFADACNSQKMEIGLGENVKKGIKGSLIAYSSVISGGDIVFNDRYLAMQEAGNYCDSIKSCNRLCSIVSIDKNDTGGKAIDGLYMAFLEKALKRKTCSIKYDELQDTLNWYYNGNLVRNELEGHAKNERSFKPEFPIGISSSREPTEKTLPSRYIDVAIGWNLSKQWNPQIGFSLPNWSVFADCYVNCSWPVSITHTMGKKEFVDKLPSKRIIGIGLGTRYYPTFFHSVFSIKELVMSDLGLSLSVQIGGIYGKETISEMETIKHWQNYICLTPAASLRFYLSKNKADVKIFFNVGYSIYFPCSKNKELELLYINKEINKEIKTKPFVANIGMSIPLYNKNSSK